MRTTLVITFLVCLVTFSYASTLYSVVQDAPGSGRRPEVSTAKLDAKKGVITNVAQNLGADFDGITLEASAFDQKGGKYYFVAGITSNYGEEYYIAGTDVVKSKVLPAINVTYFGPVDSRVITDITYSSTNQTLYGIFAYRLSSKECFLSAISPNGQIPIASVPLKLKTPDERTIRGAANQAGNVFHIISGETVSRKNPRMYLSNVGLTNGKIINNVDINTGSCPLVPKYMWVDQESGSLSVVGLSEDCKYYLATIDPTTGKCMKTLIPQLPKTEGQAFSFSSWSIDTSTNQLWISGTRRTTRPPYVYTDFVVSYDITTGKLTQPVFFAPRKSVTNLQISYKF